MDSGYLNLEMPIYWPYLEDWFMAIWWKYFSQGCNVVGARTPVRPYPVLVSDNKIQYQPKSAILLCDNKLNRRQVRRSRGGLRVLDPDAFASILGIEAGPSDPLMESEVDGGPSRRAGEIDGFVIPRGVYEGANLVSRRHSLLPDGMNEEIQSFSRLHTPDLIVLLARNRFPKVSPRRFLKGKNETCWWVQNSGAWFVGPRNA